MAAYASLGTRVLQVLSRGMIQAEKFCQTGGAIGKLHAVLMAVFLAASASADEPLGAVQAGPGEAIQIRSLMAPSVIPSITRWLRYSTEIAVRDFGSIHGHKIELGAPIDTGCSPEGGRAGAEQIIADPNILGVIGTLCSGAAVGASSVLSAAGLVMVSPANVSPVLTSDLAGKAGSHYYPGYFRIANNGLYHAQAAAEFAYVELGLRRMVSLDDGDPYSAGSAAAFANAFRALGGEIAVAARIEKGDTDMTDILAEFAVAVPDGIFFPLFESEGLAFVQQAQTVEGLRGATLIADSALLVSAFLGAALSEGIYFAGPATTHRSGINGATGKNAETVLAVLDAVNNGHPTSPYWAHAYDSITLLLRAIQAVGVEDDGKLQVDRAALRREIGATSGFQGITGVLACDEYGDCGTGRVNIYHHTDSSITDPALLPTVYRFTP